MRRHVTVTGTLSGGGQAQCWLFNGVYTHADADMFNTRLCNLFERRKWNQSCVDLWVWQCSLSTIKM